MTKQQIKQTLATAKELGLDTANTSVEDLAKEIAKRTGNTAAVSLDSIEVPKDFKMPVGRPSDPTSERQRRLAAQAAKMASGAEVKRGRPAMIGSERQLKLQEIHAKRVEYAVELGVSGAKEMDMDELDEAIIAAGGKIQRGRPTDPSSPRQKALAEKEMKRKLYFAQSQGIKVELQHADTSDEDVTVGVEK